MPDFAAKPWSRLVEILAEQAGLIGQLLVILVVAWLAIRLSAASIHRVVRALVDREAAAGTARELSAIEAQKRIETIDALVTRVVRLLIILIAGATMLEALRISVAPAIAGLGIIGVALGFGAQDLVRDYVNGALILLENQFSRGDVIQVAGVSGTVEDFSLRRTVLRDLDGRVHTVPNGAIVVASNMTRTWARLNLDVVVTHETDLEQVAAIVERVGREMAADPEWGKRILEPARMARVEAVTDLGITLKVLGTVLAADRWSGAGELRRRLLVAFRAGGVQLAVRKPAADAAAIQLDASPDQAAAPPPPGA
jgi:small-conductance mechanosensitive channel